MEALNALDTAPFDILVTQVRFPIARPNGVALARMARMRRPSIKVVLTAAVENVEYPEGLGATLTAPIDIPELVATVASAALD
jgi:CheY-like chemotaxis protein